MRYRYRTPVLHGPWRATRDAAIADAVRVRQARRADDGSLVWEDEAGLEEDAGAAPAEFARPFIDIRKSGSR